MRKSSSTSFGVCLHRASHLQAGKYFDVHPLMALPIVSPASQDDPD
jgi:hypothetical protein